MTNEQLKAFIAVVEQGSFRSAALTLFKTQPSISNSVKALESQFKLQLLDRNRYRPILTSEGKTFYRQAKKLLKQATELEMLGHQLSSGNTAKLSISLSAMCGLPNLLNKIKAFWNLHPEIQVQINTEHLSGVLEQLQLETSDLAIGPLKGVDQDYEFIEISTVNMVTVASPKLIRTDPLKTINQQQLRHIPHILISDSGTISTFEHVNIIVGGQPWYVNDYQMKKELLVSAMGWARIPEHIVKRQLEDGSLIKLKVENFNYESTIPMYLIKMKEQPLSRLAQDFWDEMSN